MVKKARVRVYMASALFCVIKDEKCPKNLYGSITQQASRRVHIQLSLGARIYLDAGRILHGQANAHFAL